MATVNTPGTLEGFFKDTYPDSKPRKEKKSGKSEQALKKLYKNIKKKKGGSCG